MKHTLFLFLILTNITAYSQFEITEIGQLPEAISNNAVVEGFIDGSPYLYSFTGIGEGLQNENINLSSFRYSIETGESITLPSVPDDMGKIACGASRIGNIIYIAGGYYVFDNGSELSSNKLHRFDIINNEFLEDGANIPIATDDHVQAVWRDSLIYLVTGWSDNANIPNVQIYNQALDSWEAGNSVPNTNNYKSFGASGFIISDTIYYYGGASSAFGFNIQNHIRKGVINPDDPTEITWSIDVPDINLRGYRMAGVNASNTLLWIGGSKTTYNFDAIAYNGSGEVSPANSILYSKDNGTSLNEYFADQIPMDLRGIAKLDESTFYLAGGILENQVVSNKVFKITYQEDFIESISEETHDVGITIYPNPSSDYVQLVSDKLPVESAYLMNLIGERIADFIGKGMQLQLNANDIPSGTYFVKIETKEKSFYKKLIIQ